MNYSRLAQLALVAALALAAAPAHAQQAPPQDSKPGWAGAALADPGVRAESAPARTAVPAASADGLVAAYGMNASTGTTVTDTSGLGNTGTAMSTAWATGKYGNALSFNGGSSVMSVPDAPSLRLSNALTLSAWVRPARVNGWRTVIAKDFSSGTAASFLLYGSDTSAPSGWLYSQGDLHQAKGASALPVNVWSHLALTYDGATARLYVDGTQAGQAPLAGELDMDDGTLTIGGNVVWGEYFEGLIDEVRIHDRARTAQEIQADMATPVPGTPPAQTTISLPLLADTYTATYTDTQPTHTALWAGSFWDGEAMQHERTYLKFDTAQLAGKTITDARLELYNSTTDGCGIAGQSLKVRRVTQNWDQNTLTWAGQPTATTAGEASATDPSGCGSVNVTWTWAMKAIAGEWAAGAANHGLVLRAAFEDVDGEPYDRAFHSSERTGTGVQPPRLTVTYTNGS